MLSGKKYPKEGYRLIWKLFGLYLLRGWHWRTQQWWFLLRLCLLLSWFMKLEGRDQPWVVPLWDLLAVVHGRAGSVCGD